MNNHLDHSLTLLPRVSVLACPPRSQRRCKIALHRIHGFKESEYYDIGVGGIEEEIRLTNERHGNLDELPPRRLLAANIQLETECVNAANRKRTFTAIFAASA